jgi:hypothetical protein
MLGFDENYDAFDTDILIFINAAISMLIQIGVGPDDGVTVKGKDEEWSILIDNREDLEDVKTYIYITVKIAFDPPSNSSVLKSLQDLRDECAWRILVQTEEVQNG